MSDLYLARRHSRNCPHRHKGRKFLACKCPLGVDGTLQGKRYRSALFTRNLEKASRALERLQQPSYQQPKTLENAIEAFLSSREYVAHGTMRNDRRVLRNLSVIAKGTGVRTLDEATIDLIDIYRTKRPISALTWTKELATLKHFFGFCKKRKWIQDNPAEDVNPPKIKPKPKEPFTRSEVARIIAACDRIGRRPYERLRARAIVLLLRYTALRVSDVAQLARDRIRGARIYLYTQKSGKPVFLPLPPALMESLSALPVPLGTEDESKYFFWSGRGTTRALIRGVTRTLSRVFEISGVPHAHAHRFRHTLATALLEQGWTTEDVSDVLGSSPNIIRKHYAQWTTLRQERVSRVARALWDDTILSRSQKESVSGENDEDILVDGMGFEPTTPTLRTWCSPS
jgi:site-specific recombinase XerD